jgi:hypothetical protein
MNARSASNTTLFLPKLSASTPDTGETNNANNAVAEVIRLFSSVVKGCPRELLIETSVAEMTPVSSTRVNQCLDPFYEVE